MKKILSCVFGICLVLSILMIGSLSISATNIDGDYTYTISNGEATITDVSTSIRGKVVIPSKLGGYPVTEIGSYAFENCEEF